MRRPTRRSGLLALALTLALAAPASAATESQSSSQTVSVLATVAISGVPASLDYGTALGGQTKPSSPASFDVTVTSNTSAITKFQVLASALAGSSTNTIPCTANRLKVAFQGGIQTWTGFTFTALPSGQRYNSSSSTGEAYPGPCDTASEVGRSSAAGSQVFTVNSWLSVPPDTTPDSYAGSLTFRITDQ